MIRSWKQTSAYGQRQKGGFSSKFLYQLSDCCVKLEISVSLHRFEEDMDDYSVIMVKALADRLAEVSSVEIVM